MNPTEEKKYLRKSERANKGTVAGFVFQNCGADCEETERNQSQMVCVVAM